MTTAPVTLPVTTSAAPATIHAFEGVRGAAALLVALFHLGLGEPAVVRLPGGYLFVDLFFVLSGFLICSTYAHKLGTAAALPSFLLRRVGRLLPLLLVATAAYVAMQNADVFAHRLFDGAGASPRPYLLPSFREVLSTVTMTHALGIFDRMVLNYAAWSISTEFYAYLAFALLCLLLRGRARLAALALTACLGYLASVWTSVHLRECLRWGGCLDLTFDYGYWRCLAGFFIGALLSHVRSTQDSSADRRTDRRRSWRHGLGLALAQAASLALLLAMFLSIERMPGVALAAPLLFGCLLLSIRSDRGPLARLLGCAPFQWLGLHSYSIYLMHPVILLGWNVWRPYAGHGLGRMLFVGAYVVLVLLVARLTFRLVEDPMRKRFNRFALRRFGAAALGPAEKTPAL